MPGFTEIENRILKAYIKETRLINSLALIREAMESIWANDAPRIVQNYTDHGVEHSERVAGFVENLLLVDPNLEFSEQEVYLLLAGVYLHDIGMQCDISKYPEIKEKAEGLGAKFKEAFTAKTTNGYSLEEQKEIRENHHYLSAAWIDYIYEKNDYLLYPAVRSIPDDLVDDLMDVCKFHSSQLPISGCYDAFRLDTTKRKRLVAALLRFADELDISSTRVKLETVRIFKLEPDNSVYWWLHNYTKVIFIGSNRIRLSVRLHPEDFKLYGSFIRYDYISKFKNKNQSILDVLVEQKIPVVIDKNSDIVEHNRAEKFPPEITAFLDKKTEYNKMPVDDECTKCGYLLFKKEQVEVGTFFGDRGTYVCKGCGRDFQDMPNDSECPDCGYLVFKKEQVEVGTFSGDKGKYFCKKCGRDFQDMPNDSECPDCGYLVFKKEQVEISNAPTYPKIEGENGLVPRKFNYGT